MTPERQLEIKKEAKRRLDLWLKNSSFDDMTVGGSFIRFNMSLGLIGYPFVKEKWMEGWKRFITDEEFDSEYYDVISSDLFYEHTHLLKTPGIKLKSK